MKAFLTQEVPLGDRLFGWWYRIAAPPEVPDEAPLRLRMRVRSGRLTSVVFLIEILVILALTTELLIAHDFPSMPGIIISFIVVVIGTILNHRGKTTIAGVLIIVIEEIGLIGTIVLVDKRVDIFVLINFFLLIGPELIAAEMIAPWVTFPITLANCLITVGMIAFMPKTPDVAFALHRAPFSIYTGPIQIQIMVSVVCFLWVSSTYREMRRANNAEEVSKLAMAIAKQQQVVQLEKQQLEASIQQIVSVHTQAANGNLHARVPLDRQNVLWAVAGSLNNLLARIQRQRYDTLQLQKNEEAHQQLLSQVQMARRQGKPLQAFTTGTSLDAVILEFSKWTPPSQPTPRESIRFKQPGTPHFSLHPSNQPDEMP